MRTTGRRRRVRPRLGRRRGRGDEKPGDRSGHAAFQLRRFVRVGGEWALPEDWTAARSLGLLRRRPFLLFSEICPSEKGRRQESHAPKLYSGGPRKKLERNPKETRKKGLRHRGTPGRMAGDRDVGFHGDLSP